MTHDEWRTAVREYVAGLAEVLGLRDWTIIVKDEPSVDDSWYAHCTTTPNRKDAVIELGRAFWDSTPEEQRETAVHELLHVHLDGPAAQVRNMETQLGTLVFEVFHEAYKMANEFATDGISAAIAQHYPLPPPRPEE